MPRRRLLIAAMFVDTFGGGLLVPFELIYALRVAGLSLPAAGLILSIGSAASIATGPLAGVAVDRLGPGRVVAAANALGVAGCASLLLWTNAWGYGIAAFLLSAHTRVFWAAYTPLVASIAAASELERWFGRLRGARYIGLAAGQALSGLAFVVGENEGLRLIVIADGISFAVTIVLVLLAAGAVKPPIAAEGEREASTGGYRAALADRANVALAGLNVAATTLLMAPILALPVFVLDRLGMPTWVPGVLTGLVTATTAAGLIFVTGLVRGRRRLRNMQLAVGMWALAFILFRAAPLDPSLAYVALVAGTILVGVGEAVYAPTADALPAALAPAWLRGRYAALHQAAWGVSETIVPALVTIGLTIGDHALWPILAGLAVATALAYRATERVVGSRDGVAGEELRSGEPLAGA
ncbi:MAG TPA: MFS transporter [candidate division Zixibacteria bacterium]|nr:MFS transporter [candidate division Zixibacteria bacterium]